MLIFHFCRLILKVPFLAHFGELFEDLTPYKWSDCEDPQCSICRGGELGVYPPLVDDDPPLVTANCGLGAGFKPSDTSKIQIRR